jgi:hypothetical protein
MNGFPNKCKQLTVASARDPGERTNVEHGASSKYGKAPDFAAKSFAAIGKVCSFWGASLTGRGLAAVSKLTRLARPTINRAEHDLDAEPLPKDRSATRAAGVARFSKTDPGARPGSQKSRRAGDAGRSDAALDLGVEKPGEARGGADRDG